MQEPTEGYGSRGDGAGHPAGDASHRHPEAISHPAVRPEGKACRPRQALRHTACQPHAHKARPLISCHNQLASPFQEAQESCGEYGGDTPGGNMGVGHHLHRQQEQAYVSLTGDGRIFEENHGILPLRFIGHAGAPERIENGKQEPSV